MGLKALFFYFVYTLGAFVFFLYLLFPGEKMAAHLSHTLNPSLAPVEMSMAHFKLYPPLGVGGEEIVFSFPDGEQVVLDSLWLKPHWTTFFDESKSIGFDMQLYRGKGFGTFKVPLSLEKGLNTMLSTYGADVEFDGIAVEHFHYGFPQGDVTLSCLAGGRFTLSKSPDRAPGGTGEITISNCAIEMDLLSALGMTGVHFSTVKITCRLQDNRLEILGCRATGPEMTIEMSGKVALATPLSKSRLDLKGRVQPDAGYLAGFSNLPPMMSALLGRFKGRGVPFKIQGRLDSPGVTL